MEDVEGSLWRMLRDFELMLRDFHRMLRVFWRMLRDSVKDVGGHFGGCYRDFHRIIEQILEDVEGF